MNHKKKFRLFFTAVSVGISLSVVYTTYDSSVDDKIANYAPPTTIASTIQTKTEPSNPESHQVEIEGLGIVTAFDHKNHTDVLVLKSIPFSKPPVGDFSHGVKLEIFQGSGVP